MDELNKDIINRRYNRRLVEHGNNMEALASGTDERRQLRYDILCGVGITAGSSVLDVGCGFGTLSKVMRSRGLDVKYTGCDINPNMIEIARSSYPLEKFLVADLQNDDLGRTFDFVVSTSSFNNPLVGLDQYDFVADLLQRAYNLSNVAIAFDFMSSYVDFRTEQAFHYEPERLFSIAKKISKRVCLRHDYPLFEFCVYIFKDFKGWGSR